MEFIKRILMGVKTRIQRATTWLSLFNSAMIFFLFLSRLNDAGYNIRVGQWFLPLLVIGALGLALIGWIEDRMGFWRLELKMIGERSPYFKDIMHKLSRIEKKLGIESENNMSVVGHKSLVVAPDDKQQSTPGQQTDIK
ncbi:MAG: hypothetical protein HYT16_01480 [DPANN group archaeon]|nr:hypothetical protein [DPANN group archaeon]